MEASGSVGLAVIKSEEKEDEGEEKKEGAARGEMKGYDKGRGTECGQGEIKKGVRYPSVPGLEFDQLKGSGVKGRRTLGLQAQWSVQRQINVEDGIILDE